MTNTPAGRGIVHIAVLEGRKDEAETERDIMKTFRAYESASIGRGEVNGGRSVYVEVDVAEFQRQCPYHTCLMQFVDGKLESLHLQPQQATLLDVAA